MKDEGVYQMLAAIISHLSNAPRDVFRDDVSNEQWNAWVDEWSQYADRLNAERIRFLEEERARLLAEMARGRSLLRSEWR